MVHLTLKRLEVPGSLKAYVILSGPLSSSLVCRSSPKIGETRDRERERERVRERERKRERERVSTQTHLLILSLPIDQAFKSLSLWEPFSFKPLHLLFHDVSYTQRCAFNGRPWKKY